jgi:hypothetical protein
MWSRRSRGSPNEKNKIYFFLRIYISRAWHATNAGDKRKRRRFVPSPKHGLKRFLPPWRISPSCSWLYPKFVLVLGFFLLLENLAAHRSREKGISAEGHAQEGASVFLCVCECVCTRACVFRLFTLAPNRCRMAAAAAYRGLTLVADMDGTLVERPPSGLYPSLKDGPCYGPVLRWLQGGGRIVLITSAAWRTRRQVARAISPPSFPSSLASRLGPAHACCSFAPSLFPSSPP